MIRTNDYLEFSEEERKTMEKLNRGFFSVRWFGEFGAEVDEFSSLEDASLYASMVDGELIRGAV